MYFNIILYVILCGHLYFYILNMITIDYIIGMHSYDDNNICIQLCCPPTFLDFLKSITIT